MTTTETHGLDEELAKPILDVIGALVVVLDAEGRILRFNKACEAATGYAFSEIEGRKVWDFLLPEDAVEGVRQVFASLRAGDLPANHSNSWLTKSGSERLIDWTNTVITGPSEEVRLVIGTGIDVTERVLIERELAAREAELSGVLESAVDAIITIDEQGYIREANPAAERMFGYASDELLGSNVSLLMPEPDRSAHDGYLARFRETGERRIIDVGRDVVARRKDGTHLPVHLSVAELQLSDRRLFTGIIHDLSERKRFEALSSRLGRIVESTLNEILVFSSGDATILQANASACRNLGYNRREIQGLPLATLCPEFNPERLEELLLPLREGQEDRLVIETLQTRRSGESYATRMQIQLVRNETPPVFFAISEDITERKAQQEQLQQALKMEAVGQLTGGLAHDFNNLLTVITGNLEMLAMQLGDDSEAAELIADAEEAADMGGQLTNRLLAFARRQPLAPKVVDPNELVLDMSELLRRTLGESIRISTVLAHHVKRTRVDPGELQNALLNLAINARDAMPDGGGMTIETADALIDAQSFDAATELEPGPYIAISVTDNGSGMTPEVLRHAMEPFFSTKQAAAGTGLGLSMVYGFAKQSGGHLQIESEPGRGTTVRITLPAAEEDREPCRPGEPSDSLPQGRGERILLVEDDPKVRGLAARRLSTLGYRVIEAVDGPAALEIVEAEEPFELLFSDIVMPGGLSGIALAEQSRALRPGLKVLLTTGFAGETTQQGLPLLRKPYRLAELADKLREVLES